MGFRIALPQFLIEAARAAVPSSIVATTCSSETCSGQGCVTCEGGPCEEMGCQGCQCAYESGQCGQGCGQGCSQSCSESCSETGVLTPPSWYLSSSINSVAATVSSRGDFTYFKFALTLNGTNIVTTNYSTNTSHTFRNLSAGTQYGVYMNWSRNTSGEGLGESKFITTDTISISPVNYSNAASIKSGSPVQIYASDLIDFRNTIYKIYTLKGYPASPFNEDLASGVTLQARHINNFYSRIIYLGGFFYQVSSGVSISAQLLLDLRNAINNIISAL